VVKRERGREERERCQEEKLRGGRREKMENKVNVSEII